MKLTYTAEDMTQELDKYGVGYKYPISGSVCDMTGFFANSKNVKAAFFAISDDGRILLVELPLLGEPQHYGIPMASVQSVKVRRILLTKSATAVVKFLHEGKTMTYNFNMASNTSFNKFPDQPQNIEGFLETLNALN